MGKSPGKWIKTLLLGRKHSKSNFSKGAIVEKNAVLEQPEENLHLDHSIVEETPYQSYDRFESGAKSENDIPGSVPCEPVEELMELHDVAGLSYVDDEAAARLEQATIKVQAAFRGYLARRAFWALKGIIRLQALIRGHLVRRQAVATLRCLYCIVRLQALARGRMVRISYPGLVLSRKGRVQEIQGTAFFASVEMTTAFRSQILSTNAFAIKLLSLMPKAMALSLHYGPEEPNSAWMWLKRWSLLHFWDPLAPPKAIIDVKSQAKLASDSTVMGGKGRSRRTFRKVASAIAGENARLSLFESDKPRRNPRKLASHQTESLQEQRQNELEKVKRNLRKASAAIVASAEKPETEKEKPLQTHGKSSNVATADMTEPGITNLSKQESESNSVVDKLADEAEKLSDSLNVDDPVPMLHPDDSVNERNSLENGTKVETYATVDEELIPKEDQIERGNQKTRRRRSLPGKQEYHENVSQNTASLPSYMAATKSAKAKLRLQGSVTLSEDGDKNGFIRRHSLPTSTNGKLSSLSPRLQKPAQANGKEERVLQLGWRR